MRPPSGYPSVALVGRAKDTTFSRLGQRLLAPRDTLARRGRCGASEHEPGEKWGLKFSSLGTRVACRCHRTSTCRSAAAKRAAVRGFRARREGAERIAQAFTAAGGPEAAASVLEEVATGRGRVEPPAAAQLAAPTTVSSTDRWGISR